MSDRPKQPSLREVLHSLRAARTVEQLESRFELTWDCFRRRTQKRIRRVVRERGIALCEMQDKRHIVPRWDSRRRRLIVCGKTYRVEHGGNSTGIRYAWHHAYEWMKKTLHEHGCSEPLTQEILDWWRDYPHRSLRALQASRKRA
jgi:hypothetical protein